MSLGSVGQLARRQEAENDPLALGVLARHVEDGSDPAVVVS